TMTSGTSSTMALIASSAAGVRSAISMTRRPPARIALAIATASRAFSTVTTGMTGLTISGVGSETGIEAIWDRETRLRKAAERAGTPAKAQAQENTAQEKWRTKARPAIRPPIEIATEAST